MTDKIEPGKFTVWGCDSHNLPHWLGCRPTRGEAEKYQKEMETAGWQRVAIFDAAHQEQIATLQKEVEAKDKEIGRLEELLKRQQGLGYGRG